MDNITVLNKFKEYFDSHEMQYKWDETNDIISLSFAFGNKIGNIREFIIVRSDSYTVRALCALHADANSQLQILEYLMRANYGLIFGNFEMDFEDGEILFKVTHSINSISESDIESSIMIPLAMFKRYGEGLIKVAFSLATPKEAIEEAESVKEE